MDRSLDIAGLPAFADNYLWLLRRGREAVVVDPGDAAPVEQALRADGLRLAAILLTHHHRDHTGGAAALAAQAGCPVYGPAGESIAATTVPLCEGDTVDALDLRFAVLDTPGHTRGHIAYHCEDEALLFCGDTLFAAGCGKLFEGTPAQMWRSLRKLAALPDETRVYCAHEYTLSNLRFARLADPGNAAIADRQQAAGAQRARNEPTVPSTIGLERRTNPFMRADEPAIAQRAESMASLAVITAEFAAQNGGPVLAAGPVRTLALLRAWKNTA